MRDVTVCIPWRPTHDRIDAFEKVVGWWEANGFPVIAADTPHAIFNVAAARNAAVEGATTEQIVVADADTIPELPHVLEAIQLDGVTWPFQTYRYLGTATPAADEVGTSPFERDFRSSVGGVLVTTKTTYWAVGGMDERFRQWGYEDTAFRIAAQTLACTNRTEGTVYAYGHSADRDMTDNNPGRHRLRLYNFARGNPDLMRELIAC